jgi:ribosome recycling factor
MVKEIIEKKRPEIEKTLEYFKEELSQIRTGRASSALVENLLVDYYGARSPIKQVATISIPEPRTIVISPWDKGSLIYIEKAIKESQLNLTPNNDGNVIRINLPALTEDRRKEFTKLLNQKAEEARIAVRKHREDAWEEIQAAEKSGKIGEDDKFTGKNKLQEVIDEYNAKIEEIRTKKEQEIMTI